MAQLRDMILKWHRSEEDHGVISGNSFTAAANEIDSPASLTENELLDVNTLNGVRALQSPKSPNILEQLFEIYRSTAPELLQNLDSAIQDGNCEAIRESAHSLKSSSGNIGARKIFELSAKLEDMGRDEEIDDAGAIFAEVEQLFPKVCELLEQEVRRPAA